MRMQFTMVPLPMTAAEKFHEAAYFYNQMIATVNNTRTFPFNLSAFLSALRSTTFYLQVQYGRDRRFADWYAGAQDIMKKDPNLKLLNDFRVETIHQKPVNLVVTSGPKFHENPITLTATGSITLDSDSKGNIIWKYQTDETVEEREAEPLTEWTFERNGMSVLAACRNGLEKLDILLRHWNDLFGSQKPPGEATA
jgi:hypothetical protein